MKSAAFKKYLLSLGLNEKRREIEARLNDFRSVPRKNWLRELSFCILTPQSDPFRAEACIEALERKGLYQGRPSVAEVATELRNPARYIRFHNTKAKRLLDFVKISDALSDVISGKLSPAEERAELISRVDGFGLKEASHGLRNIGRSGLAILDRHILRCLAEANVIKEVPKTLPKGRYLEIEKRFQDAAEAAGVSMDALDLLFWSSKTGKIFK